MARRAYVDKDICKQHIHDVGNVFSDDARDSIY
jgi:hypothetical protein